MTKIFGSILSVLGLAVLLTSCEKKTDSTYSNIPLLTNQGISTNVIRLQVDSGDWLWKYDFVDGDGDLGTKIEDQTMRIFVKNEVTNAVYEYPFPYIPSSARSGKKYLKGDGTVVLDMQTFFKLRTDIPDRTADTFVFTLYILDEAGNQSNTLKCDSVFVFK